MRSAWAAEHGIEFAPHALRDAGGVVHQPRDLVEKPVGGLHHGASGHFVATRRSRWSSHAARQWRSPRHRRKPAAARPQISSRIPMPPVLVLPFPAIDPVLVSSDRLPFAGTRSPISPASCSAGSTRARSSAVERLWGGQAPMTVADFDDFILWVTLGIILGGRIGYVLFYNLPHFAAHPLRDRRAVEGRHVVPRRLLGCVVAVVLFARKRGIPFLSLGDLTCAVGADRPLPRAHRQFHQRRIVGPPDRRALGDGVSRRRPAAAPSEPALRGDAGRRCCCSSCWPLLIRLGALQPAGPDHRRCSPSAMRSRARSASSSASRTPQLGFLWGGSPWACCCRCR